MIVLNENTIQESMKGKYLLVQFGSDWCRPCGIMKKNLRGLERTIITEKLEFGYVDTEKSPVLEQLHKIEFIPTVVLFKNGKELGRMTGCKRGEEVKKFIKECLEK